MPRRFSVRRLALGLASLTTARFAPAAPASLPAPTLLKTNGGWCWFQDERALVVRDTLVFGSVAGTTRAGGSAGDVDVTAVDLHSGRARSTPLHPKFQSDDHDTPAFLALPDGRVLATYQSHGSGKGVNGLEIGRAHV